MAVATLMVVAVAVLVLTIREKKLAQQVDIDDGEAEDEEQETGVKTGMPREVRRSFIFILASIFLFGLPLIMPLPPLFPGMPPPSGATRAAALPMH